VAPDVLEEVGQVVLVLLVLGVAPAGSLFPVGVVLLAILLLVFRVPGRIAPRAFFLLLGVAGIGILVVVVVLVVLLVVILVVFLLVRLLVAAAPLGRRLAAGLVDQGIQVLDDVTLDLAGGRPRVVLGQPLFGLIQVLQDALDQLLPVLIRRGRFLVFGFLFAGLLIGIVFRVRVPGFLSLAASRFSLPFFLSRTGGSEGSKMGSSSATAQPTQNKVRTTRPLPTRANERRLTVRLLLPSWQR
jgi:hypothetical protein